MRISLANVLCVVAPTLRTRTNERNLKLILELMTIVYIIHRNREEPFEGFYDEGSCRDNIFPGHISYQCYKVECISKMFKLIKSNIILSFQVTDKTNIHMATMALLIYKCVHICVHIYIFNLSF